MTREYTPVILKEQSDQRIQFKNPYNFFRFLNHYSLKSLCINLGNLLCSIHSKQYCAKFAGGVSALLHRILRLRRPFNGGILIEFTFSIPVCIALLFLVNDHYRFYELRSKVRTSTYLAASMIQHVTNTRTDKQLTKADLQRISYASCLNLFHTNSMFKPWPLGIYYAMFTHYVKRVNSNSYQCQESCATMSSGNAPNNGSMCCWCNSYTMSLSQIQAKSPNLVCDKDGEERVIIACHYRKHSSFSKNKLGFFILEPKTRKGLDAQTNNFFIYEVTIVPKPGLFPVKD